jgi:1-acyl-sn-glycerol-3-phosphate acyltransferase
MGRAGRILLTVWGVVWALAWVVLVGAGFLAGSLVLRGPWWTDRVQRFFCWVLLLGVGIRIRVEGTENIPQGTPCVIMGNHRSYLDIPAIVLGLRNLTVLFVAKRELTRIPFFGWALGASHHIKVDRGDREQAIRALQEGLERLGSGIGLVVFPEGTRSRTARLLPFKKGGFYVAVDGTFPILPVSIRNSGHLLGKMQLLVRSGIVSVTVHPPVSTRELSRRDIPELTARVRGLVLAGLPDAAGEEARRDAGGDRTDAGTAGTNTARHLRGES